jgi:hypothetical protein
MADQIDRQGAAKWQVASVGSLGGAVRAAFSYARKPAHKFRRLLSQGTGGELCSRSTAA